MLVIALAHAAEIPEEWRGTYILQDVVDSWTGDAPQGSDGYNVEVKSDSLWFDHVFDGTPYPVLGRPDTERFTVKNGYQEGEAEISFEGTDPVVLHFDDRSWVRVDEVFPAIPDDWRPDRIATRAALAQGFVRGETPWIFLDANGGMGLLDGPSAEGGYSGFGNILVVGDTEYLFEGGPSGLSLQEAAPEDGPDRYAKDDGDAFELTPMDWPFLVVADRLNLREAPESGARVVGVVEGGRPVRVWVAQDGWLLILDQSTLGWGSAKYVLRRSAPVASRMDDHPFTLVEALSDADPVVVHDVQGSAGCEVEGQKTPAVPASIGASVLLTNLDGAEPLDVICIVEAAGAYAVCPITRSAKGVEVTPCGTFADLPKAVGSEAGKGGRALKIDDAVFPRTEAGWLDGKLPEPPPPPEPEAPPAAEAPEATGGTACLCATAPVPLLGWWLLSTLAYRRRR
ncbi:MAG: SH3 domain-containing protein [Alphaproteobacteria bacterium]|nr:SH3 domain-containing protein [Alphaproteobacteria bacterium]